MALAMGSAHDTTDSPHALHSPLTLLPSVIAHLVMQQLRFEELASLASTCRLMRDDALHPASGRFLRSVSCALYGGCRRIRVSSLLWAALISQ